MHKTILDTNQKTYNDAKKCYPKHDTRATPKSFSGKTQIDQNIATKQGKKSTFKPIKCAS